MDVARATSRSMFRDALAVLVDRPGLSSTERNEQIDGVLRYAERRGLSFDHCLVARENDRIVASCLCIDAPGRTSSVFVPGISYEPEVGEAVVRLLDETIRLGRERNVQILQATVEPGVSHESQLLAQAGFEWLAELIYLDSDVTKPLPMGPPLPSVTWEKHSEQTHGLFAEVVQGTYEDSLDCVQLNGIRSIEDILASHRGTGEFDPDCWWVGTVACEPVGVLLLAYLPERWSYEVVYMGLLPAWRGRGYGSVLLRKAIELVRERAGLTLTLAVDVKNKPARKLYKRFGFVETLRRDVWIRLL